MSAPIVGQLLSAILATLNCLIIYSVENEPEVISGRDLRHRDMTWSPPALQAGHWSPIGVGGAKPAANDRREL